MLMLGTIGRWMNVDEGSMKTLERQVEVCSPGEGKKKGKTLPVPN
jgi:hypothetical protein